MGSNLCMGGTRRCDWVCNQAQGGTLSPRIPLARGCIMTDIAELFYRKVGPRPGCDAIYRCPGR